MAKLFLECKVSIPRAGEIIVKVPIEEFTHNYDRSTTSDVILDDAAEWVAGKIKVKPLKGELRRVMKKVRE